MIKFGPTGLGPVKDAVNNLEEFSKLGFSACEVLFTYGAYIKSGKDAQVIKLAAQKNKILLSIHAHYWINLNSEEKQKVEMSKKRILECCFIGEQLGAYRVVFHPGFYGKFGKEESYQKIKAEMQELMATIKKNEWKIKLAPETTGKVNVFGSVEEISQLVKDTGCEFCIDFAHILAREKKVNYPYIIESFPEKQWHCHFSGIEYSEKGEKNHKKTTKEEWTQLLKNLPKTKDITIINESPFAVEDTIIGMKVEKEI
jgi:deoxyribonuclease IV